MERTKGREFDRDTMDGSGAAAGKATESSRSLKRLREKSKLRRSSLAKSSDKKSTKVEKKRMKQQMKMKMKKKEMKKEAKMKKKKRSSTIPLPEQEKEGGHTDWSPEAEIQLLEPSSSVEEATENSRSLKRLREKSKLRRSGLAKSSDNKSTNVEKKRMKQQMKMKIKKKEMKEAKMKLKMKKKKRSSTDSLPEQEKEEGHTDRSPEAEIQLLKRTSGPVYWPKFPETLYTAGIYYTIREKVLTVQGPFGPRSMPYRVAGHVAAESKAQNSKLCQFLAKYAVDEFNKSYNANLKLELIENVNCVMHYGSVFLLRFVAKDLNTGYTGLYRAAVHLHPTFTAMRLLHFKDEELEWQG